MFVLAARAPVIALYGSSFPIWLFAAVGGVIFAVLVRQILIIANVHRQVPLAGLFYTALALLAALIAYMIWIGGFGA